MSAIDLIERLASAIEGTDHTVNFFAKPVQALSGINCESSTRLKDCPRPVEKLMTKPGNCLPILPFFRR